MTPRLTSAMLAGSLIRVCEAAGGHAMLLAKGDETAGSLLISLYHKGRVSGLFEQLLDAQGRYRWMRTGPKDDDDQAAFDAYIHKRRTNDPDLWVIELDIADGQRLIAEWGGDG